MRIYDLVFLISTDKWCSDDNGLKTLRLCYSMPIRYCYYIVFVVHCIEIYVCFECNGSCWIILFPVFWAILAFRVSFRGLFNEKLLMHDYKVYRCSLFFMNSFLCQCLDCLKSWQWFNIIFRSWNKNETRQRKH